jgi:hypothetical protein
MAKSERDPQRERFWRDVLGRFRASRLSVRAFCRRENLGEPLFYAWRRTIAERDAEMKTVGGPRMRRERSVARRSRPVGTGSLAPFLPVMIHEPTAAVAPGGYPVAIELRGGRVLRFAESLSARRVAEVVCALEAMEAAS